MLRKQSVSCTLSVTYFGPGLRNMSFRNMTVLSALYVYKEGPAVWLGPVERDCLYHWSWTYGSRLGLKTQKMDSVQKIICLLKYSVEFLLRKLF
jgi:hypothetical protein